MTTTRDPDRRLQAWLDLMPDEAPDRVISAVLQATEHAPQTRDLLGPALRRFSPMNRVSLAAAAAVILAVVAGGALFFKPGSDIGGPMPSPTPTPQPTPVATLAPGTTPEALRSVWVANAPTGPAGALLTLTIDASVISVLDAGSESVLARAATGSDGEFAFVAPDSNHGCQSGDVGRYSFAFGGPADDTAAGDLLLALTATSDACAARQAILERSWTRAFTSGFVGGRAVAIDFDPMFMVTLPAGAYDVTGSGPDALMVESPTEGGAPGAFVATRNPAGFSEPCSETGGSKLQLAHTVDAFAAYMASLPGFTVERADVEIGGLPAVHLTVPTTITADCPRADHRVLEWSTSAVTFPVNWQLTQGEVTDSIYLVEVGSDLYLFQWLRPTVDEQVEMSVLSTLTFIDTIPD